MKKLLIALLIAAPLVASAAATYKITFENQRDTAVTLAVVKDVSLCMRSFGASDDEEKFTLAPNQAKTITTIDKNGAFCANELKSTIWRISSGGLIKFFHWNEGSIWIFGGTWYTSIEGDIKSATCDGKDCTNKKAKSSGDFDINIKF